MSDSIQRLGKYIDFKNIKVSVFEKKTGMSNASFGKALKEKRSIGTDKLENILKIYTDINPQWILTGKGPMLKEDATTPMVVNEPTEKYNIHPEKQDNRSEKSYPLVDVYAIGGFGNADFSIEQKNIKDHYVIPAFKNCNIDFMIEVKGDSMYPIYSSGDIVACSIIRTSNFIQWNRVHIIATKEQGILIKRLKQSKKNGFLTAISDNNNYEPFDLPKDEITGMALVIGGVRVE